MLVELLNRDELVAQRLGAGGEILCGRSGWGVGKCGRGSGGDGRGWRSGRGGGGGVGLAFLGPELPFEAEFGDADGFEDGLKHGGAAGGGGGVLLV